MYELVRVGTDNLIGEIIRLEGDSATIQVRFMCLLMTLSRAVCPALRVVAVAFGGFHAQLELMRGWADRYSYCKAGMSMRGLHMCPGRMPGRVH